MVRIIVVLCLSLFCTASFAQRCGGAGQPPCSVPSGSVFNVPFFIEQATAPPYKSVLRADFTLAAPAILESISMSCGGAALYGLLYVDGGPLDKNGATGVAADPSVGLVVGLFGPILAPFYLPIVSPPAGGSYLPVTKIGAAVKSGYSFLVFPDTTKGVQCNVSVIFRTI